MSGGMPGYGGLNILASLQQLPIHMPVILITAFGTKAAHDRAARLGAFAMLDKPFDLDDLMVLVRAAMFPRVGAKDGGEPAAPVVWNELLLYSLARDGVFLADRRTGETLEYFSPGEGVSATPTVTGDGRLFVMSNRGILYAFDLE